MQIRGIRIYLYILFLVGSALSFSACTQIIGNGLSAKVGATSESLNGKAAGPGLAPNLVFTNPDMTASQEWRVNHQTYDIALTPERILSCTGYPFETYTSRSGQFRLVIKDSRDGLWRYNPETLCIDQSHTAEEVNSGLSGDQHTLAFSAAKRIHISRLDLWNEVVEEALKFSKSQDILGDSLILVSGPQAEDNLDIVRGYNLTFRGMIFVPLGQRAVTIKGGARQVYIYNSRFGIDDVASFQATFPGDSVDISGVTFSAGQMLLPKTTYKWIPDCPVISKNKAHYIEIGMWSDYDIGWINGSGKLEKRGKTKSIFITADFRRRMTKACDYKKQVIPVVFWDGLAEDLTMLNDAWVMRPGTGFLGDWIQDEYVLKNPSDSEKQAIREKYGAELDYWGNERNFYKVHPNESGNHFYFGSFTNLGKDEIESKEFGRIRLKQGTDLDKVSVDGANAVFVTQNYRFFHYPSNSWITILNREPSAGRGIFFRESDKKTCRGGLSENQCK